MTEGGLQGHDTILRNLRRQVVSGTVSHSYLIEGAEGAGKKTLARDFAMALVCKEPQEGKACGRCSSCRVFLSGNHPDVHVIRPDEKGSIPVQTIREELVQDIEILPYYNGRKIYIVEDAQNLSQQAQNVLLKTIEEPPEYAVILLLTTSVQSFLPTVISRCVQIRLLPLPEALVASILHDQYGIEEQTAVECAAFSGGSVGKALQAASSEEYGQLRARWLDKLQRLSGLGPVDVMQWSKDLEGDQAHMEDVLRILEVWFRDLVLVCETGDTSLCMCRGQAEALRKSAAKYDKKELYRKIEILEDARSKRAHNVNFGLWADWLLSQLALRSV